MFTKRTYLVFSLLLLLAGTSLWGQYFQLSGESERSPKIRFELINNLVIVPVEVNGTPLRFILDSGVSKPILFNLSDQDSIQLKNVSRISIKGLGGGEPIEALASVGNTFRLANAANFNQAIYVVLDKDLNFSPALGVTVHGIIGYDIFRDFVVELNYGRKFLRLHHPDHYRGKSSAKEMSLPLEIQGSKAYLKGEVVVQGGEAVPVKLLMDTGSSDAVWLFPDPEAGLPVPDKNYEDFLGKGLSGTIFGKRTRIERLQLGDFVLQDAKAAFPYMESFQAVQDLGDRNGSLGGEVLKRFNMVVNYPAGEVVLGKNTRFSSPFHFNMAGIEIEHAGVRYIAERITDARGVVRQDEVPFGNVQIMLGNQTRVSLVPEIVVSAIRAGSPAEEVGLREGDIILAVNGKKVHQYKLQEIVRMINEKQGKRVRLLIERTNRNLMFSFVLRDLFE
ncbi:aspartyl protease family protein [Robiginitalea sp. M366]|uniref:aspartyl protease family protein n=1 Tax=Robiginitalea aestuariiviva TaxID=3036903 RepID=UPI00240D306E|nr:aspartyl protease family protein [Robiginitalea aestuariiviva]MDG1570757.1 aspartyl protease family protein [Robiginitalea aestuariiviva]